MEKVKIGWGKREISMEGPVIIPGQMCMRISEGILDPLYATVLVVDGGSEQDAVIFCSCDLISVKEGLVEEIAAAVSEMNPDVPVRHIVLNTTHTHSSMDYWSDLDVSDIGEPVLNGKTKVRPYIVKKCAEAICEAWESRTEGGIGYGYGYAVVGHSRRVVYSEDVSLRNVNSMAPNGHAVMYGFTDDDKFSHYEGGADHFLNLMFTFDPDKNLTGMIVNIPCPSQLSEKFNVLSADYWHDIRLLVEKEFGSNVYVLPQCAAAGDLSPRILHYLPAQCRRMKLKYGLEYDPLNRSNYNKAMGERRDIAQRVIWGIREVFEWAKEDIKTSVQVHHICKQIYVDRRMITAKEKEWCERNIEHMKQNPPDTEHGTAEEIRFAISDYNSFMRRNKNVVMRYEIQNENPTIPVNVHVVQVDDIGFVTNSFELFHDYMHRVQARSPFLQTFVSQLAGDGQSSYLATQRAADNKGYSACLFCNQVSPEGGQQWVEETLTMMEALKCQDWNNNTAQ